LYSVARDGQRERMRVAVVGGGPGGLFLAALLRKADPSVEVTVVERNRADDTFGFGVVFSDRTLAAIDDADPVLHDGLAEHGVHWDDIEVRLKGDVLRCGGNGMAAISRKVLLGLLQDRARVFGAELRFSTEVRLGDLDGYDSWWPPTARVRRSAPRSGWSPPWTRPPPSSSGSAPTTCSPA
jgi:2-polyprenyl-6-methoxyphenol hydroxylase-like FAD-dependent oxidoreductase